MFYCKDKYGYTISVGDLVPCAMHAYSNGSYVLATSKHGTVCLYSGATSRTVSIDGCFHRGRGKRSNEDGRHVLRREWLLRCSVLRWGTRRVGRAGRRYLGKKC